MDEVAQKDFSYRMTQKECFLNKKELVDLSQKFWKTGPLRDRSCFKDALTTLTRLHYNLDNNNSGQCILEVSKVALIIEFFLQQLVTMERFLVEFTTISKKNHKWAYVHSDMIKRCGPLSAVFGKNLRRAIFILFLLQLDRLPLTAVCCNRRWVYRQHLTSPIFQFESPQGIPVQVRKWISLVHWQPSELVTQNDKSNNMCNELKHVETHDYIQWLVNAVDWTTAELVCFCSLSSLSLVSASLDCFFLFRFTQTALAQGWQELRFTFIRHCSRMCQHVVSVVPDLFDFTSLIISLINVLFLLPCNFNFHGVVEKYPAHSCWGPWHPGRGRASHSKDREEFMLLILIPSHLESNSWISSIRRPTVNRSA